MKLRSLGVLVIILLTGCTPQSPTTATSPSVPVSRPETSTAAPTPTPSPTPTPAPPRPAVLAVKDRATLAAILGPAPDLSCSGGHASWVKCGRTFAGAQRRVDAVLAAVKKMPTTKPYREIAQAGAAFKSAYRRTVAQGCFTSAPPQDRVGADFCLFQLLSTNSAYRALTDHLAP